MRGKLVLALVCVLFIHLIHTVMHHTRSLFQPYQYAFRKPTFSNLKWGKNDLQIDNLVSCLARGTTPDQRFNQNPDINKNIHTYLNNSSLVLEVGGNVVQDSAVYIQL